MFFKHSNKQQVEIVSSDYEIATEASICTGEKLIGLRNKHTGKLEKAVVVKSQKDIDDFYSKYKISQKDSL